MLAANFGFYANFVEQKNPTTGPKNRESFDYGAADAYDFFLKHQTMDAIYAIERGRVAPDWQVTRIDILD